MRAFLLCCVAAIGCGPSEQEVREAYLVECEVMDRLKQALTEAEAEQQESLAEADDLKLALDASESGRPVVVNGKSIDKSVIKLAVTKNKLAKLGSEAKVETLREMIEAQRRRVRGIEFDIRDQQLAK